MSATHRPRAFLVRADDDSPVARLAEELKRCLELRGVEVDLARTDFDREWSPAIEREIGGSSGVVVLWTRLARDSALVGLEIQYAERVGRPICLVLHGDAPLPDGWARAHEWVLLKGIGSRLDLTSLFGARYTGSVDKTGVELEQMINRWAGLPRPR